MKSRLSILTLGVSDLAKSTAFYQKLGFELQTEESTAGSISFFSLNDGSLRLALFPRKKLSEDIGIEFKPSVSQSFTLAHNVSSPELVDQTLNEAAEVGAKVVKSGQKVFWGGYSGYFSDPDGYFWEVAHNPFTDLI